VNTSLALRSLALVGGQGSRATTSLLLAFLLLHSNSNEDIKENWQQIESAPERKIYLYQNF
jgi:hypothetical protein